jgi:predicted histone-like DNA-binding protein
MDSLTDNMNPEESKKKGLYPRIISKKTVFFDELLRRATAGTSLSAAEARMAFDIVFEQIIEELKSGNSVCINNIGMFSLTAKSRRVQNENEIRSASIEVNRLVFRMSKAFLRKLGRVEFVRLPKNRKK